MNSEQLKAAKKSMEAWLDAPDRLGKKPTLIESVGNFELNDMTYYMFKFKKGLLGKWLIGIAGGYRDDETEACGHTFSNMKEYDPQTAKNDCIAMVDEVKAYWEKQADELDALGFFD